MKAVEFFVSRSRLAAVVAITILIVGAVSVYLLPLTLYPTLARPAISVSCTYPGANAVEVMNTVAGPLEEKINGVEGMNRMKSACHDNGSYSLTVDFDVGYDEDVALMKVQSKVQQALSLLPQEVKNTGVTVESGSTEELGILTLRSPGGKLTPDQIADYVFGVVNPAIQRVQGVGKSTVKADKLAVRVWMDPEKIAALGLGTDDVVAAIKTQNVQASLGTVGGRPTANPDTRVVTLVSKGRLSSVEEFRDIVVATGAKGGLVRLGDVARIEMGPQGFSYAALYEEQPAVYVMMYLLPGANPLETMKEVKGELSRLQSFFPADLTWDMTYDTTNYMKRALSGVVIALGLAVLVVLAGLWAAFRSLSAALVSAVSTLVPASVTAFTLVVSGFQVNLFTIYAFIASLAFSAGLAGWTVALVRNGRLPGMGNVAAGVTFACAAIPLAFVDGVQGTLFRQFSVVFVSMGISSGFNSFLLVPVIAKRMFARNVNLVSRNEGDASHGIPIGKRFIALILASLCGIVAYVLYSRLPQEFVPDEDMGVLYVDCKTAEGTPMEKTSEVMRRVYREARELGGIEKCVTLLGESIINGSGENQAKMLLVLKDWRERGEEDSSYNIARRVQKIAADIPEAEIFALRIPPVNGMGTQGGLTVLLQSIGDNDPVKFSREVLKMRAEFEKSPLVETVTGGFYADTPHLRVKVDREKCELMKVPMSSVYTVLQHNFGSIYINDVNIGTQVNRVTAMSDWTGRASSADISKLYVRSAADEMVPLDALVTCSEELGPRSCYRCNQYLYCTEQFIPKAHVSTSEAIEEVLRICREKLSPGFINDWSGLVYESLKSRGDEGFLLGLSLFLVYLVLVACCESWRKAFWMLLPSSVAVLGAFTALYVSGVAFSVYSRYAVVMLVASTAAMSILSGDSRSFKERAALPLLSALTMLPLVFAAGAGSVGGRSFGVAFLGGYAAYALLGFFLPMGKDSQWRTKPFAFFSVFYFVLFFVPWL